MILSTPGLNTLPSCTNRVLPVNDSWVSNDDVCTLFVDGHGLRRVGNLKINVELIYVVKSIIADPVQRLLKYSHG